MFSKINFTYKKPGQNSQSYLILREQLVKQKIKENEKKSLINCISLQNKVDSKKLQNTSDIFEQSRETNINHDNTNNTIIEMKLQDSSSINTKIIDNVIQHEIIIDNETGMLYSFGDINELAQKIHYLYTNVAFFLNYARLLYSPFFYNMR